MSDERDKKRRGIFAIISPHVNRAEAFLFLLLCSLLILAFVVPTCVIPVPYGTDVYSHLFMTHEMSSVSSLSDFYETCLEEGYLRYDYPFGLWLFGSIVAKVTGMGMLELSLILPFAIMLVLMILYYSYAQVFGVSPNAVLSVIFLLSIPLLCMGILGYSTSVFVEFFLIFILYLILIEKEKISLWKRVLLMNVFIFTLCFTHTGTYMFLLPLTIVFLFIYAALYGDFHREAYMATTSMMFVYIITMHLFPYVHPQYIDKGRILVSVGDFISSDLHVPFASGLAQTFYEHIFVALNPLYVVLGCLSIYAICRLLIFLRSKIKVKISVQKLKEKLPEKFFSVPIIGSIRHVSHSVLYTPFWLGPVHVILAVIGVFKTNRNGLCMLLSVAIITILPGHMAGASGLREIGYLFIIIPVLAALGFYHAKTKVESCMNTKLQKSIVAILLLAVFSSIVVLPVVGNLYYHPLISGPNSERASLQWLSNVGSPNDGCAGWGYRHMISAYANKVSTGITSVAAGSEMSRFMQDQYSASFSMNSEEHAKDLYATFGVKYLIVSKRTMRNLGGTPEQLRIDYNKQLDKIYSSTGHFSFYKYITSPVHRTDITPQLNFADDALIKDAGDSYLVDTDEYKVRISKATPGILYIGNKTINFLGEGGIYDYILITWSVSHHGQFNGYVLQELPYSSVIIGNNQIIYKTVLKNENRTADWATLTVKYTFFEKAMKKEIIVANDWVNDSHMNARVTMMLLTPMNHFIFQNEDNPAKKRTVYPCEDTVPLNKIKFNKIFINDSTSGIYIEYEKTAPYPNRITYSGLIRHIYEYYSMDMSMEKSVYPSETMHLTQWLSTGDEQTAKSNVEHYSSVSLYPYPDGKIPILLTSRISSLNTTSKENFNATLNAHEKIREVGVANYTEAVNVQDKEINTSRMSQLLERGAYIIGYEEVEGRNITAQEEKIEKMKGNAQRYGIEIKGFMPKGLRYDLETIKVLADQNMTFIVAKRIMPAFDIYFQEGLRQPQMAYYHGDATNLVLLPVSEPTIGGPTYFYDNYPEAWKAVIDSVIKNEDLCVFLWDSEKAGMPEHINDTINVIRYAKERGMTFTAPYEIANHFSLLQNVSAVVSKNDDESTIIISIRNENEEPVYGVTFKVETHGGTAEYAVNNGQIVRKASSGTKWIYYVSTDLASKETKEIVLGYR